jgi:hypothetical protein
MISDVQGQTFANSFEDTLEFPPGLVDGLLFFHGLLVIFDVTQIQLCVLGQVLGHIFQTASGVFDGPQEGGHLGGAGSFDSFLGDYVSIRCAVSHAHKGFTPLLGYKNCFGIDEFAEVTDLILGQGGDIPSQTLDVV